MSGTAIKGYCSCQTFQGKSSICKTGEIGVCGWFSHSEWLLESHKIPVKSSQWPLKKFNFQWCIIQFTGKKKNYNSIQIRNGNKTSNHLYFYYMSDSVDCISMKWVTITNKLKNPITLHVSCKMAKKQKWIHFRTWL